ncbi:MAG: M28 family peptidase [Anaerolineales bacterium]|nr:M28 family peptidase [Anaerolineales bacterium]
MTIRRAETHIRKLCVEIEDRATGSPGNRSATDYFAQVLSGFGFKIDQPAFECIDWSHGGADLSAGAGSFEAHPGPYTLGCRVKGPLAVVSSAAELADADLAGWLLLLRGEIAAEQVMPKNFPFYNPDHHQELVRTLEAKSPLAVIAATGRNPELAGGMYPFPLFEDGDFDIPSVYMRDVDGAQLAAWAGRQVSLEIRAERRPSAGCNVVARKGASFPARIVLFAHIDSKPGTPGASDNASGITVLLLLAELLAEYNGALAVEISAINGEDYFSSPGEQLYLAQNVGSFADIILGINIDGVGYHKSAVGYTLYGCPDQLSALIERSFSRFENIVRGSPWYAGDHALFMMNQVPALALTSEPLGELITEITHTPKDTPDILRSAHLVETAEALHDLVLALAQGFDPR